MKRIRAMLFACTMILSLVVPCGAAALESTTPHERGIPMDWRADHPDVPHTFSNMGPRSLGIDINDHLYLAYGSDHLYFTHNEGSGWATPEVVDPDWGVGQGVSLAVDTGKKVHISYVDTALGGLRYATNKGGSWVINTLLTSSSLDPHTALALDTSGRPHILYHDLSSDSMGYTHLMADGTWGGYPVNSPGEGGGEVALAIGSDNRLHVSFYKVKDGPTGCLMYQRTGSYGWETPIEIKCINLADGPSGTYSAIAIDTQNNPHIAFNNVDMVGYIYYDSNLSSWSEIKSSTAGGLTALSIVVDGSNRAHISYKANNSLKYAVNDHGNWDFSVPLVVDTGTDIGQYNSLVLDSNGLPHVTYFNPNNGSLISRAYKNSAWQPRETIDTLGNEVGRCTSLAFSANGTASLTYFDAVTKQIKYATKAAGGTWNLALPVVDAPGPVFCQHSLALRNGIPAVAYTTETGELRYAEYTCRSYGTCSWKSWHVSDVAWVPESVSLAINSLNKPRISFTENVQANLAYNDGSSWGSGWNLSQIDISAASGQTSLAIDSNDKARVAYFRNATHDLYYAVQDGTNPVTWNDPKLVDDNNAGTYVSLKLYSAFNLAFLAYTSQSGQALRFRQQGLLFPNIVWESIKTVANTKVESPSLSLDSTGWPTIFFYYSGNNQHLYQAFKQGSAWKMALLDGNTMVGRGLSLAISPLTGKPALSYFDENVSGLKYLYQLDEVFLPLMRK